MTSIAAEAITEAGTGQLVLAAVLGIAVVVVLIAWAKWHPFLSLILGSAVLGLVAGASPGDTIDSFTAGLGSTVGSVGLLIALGSMIGALLAESGGADGIVNRIVNSVTGSALPWAMAGVAALIGLPLFFEVGVVLLVPIVLLVARRTDIGLLRIGIPALAGLSVLHGLVPPHPGPLVAIANLNADLGLTLMFGLICAIPTVIVAGPIYGNWIAKRVPLPVPALSLGGGGSADRPADGPAGGQDFVDRDDVANPSSGGPDVLVDEQLPRARRNPGFWPAVLTVLVPIVLMLARAIGELALPEDDSFRGALEIIGEPVVALLAGVLLATWSLGKRAAEVPSAPRTPLRGKPARTPRRPSRWGRSRGYYPPRFLGCPGFGW
ncbi:MAG: SLC13 family permease [Actinomycetota bacterium]|nr:SLC13 family permease [Actinomycetota bacterium]